METTYEADLEKEKLKGRIYPGAAGQYEALIEMITQYCKSEQIEMQIVKDETISVIQARKVSKLRSALGMRRAVTIKIVNDMPDLIIDIGMGEWVSNLMAATVSSLIFAPMLLVSVIGLFASGFSDTFEEKIDYFIANV